MRATRENNIQPDKYLQQPIQHQKMVEPSSFALSRLRFKLYLVNENLENKRYQACHTEKREFQAAYEATQG